LADGLEHVKQTIYGMDCAPCAYGIEQGLKALSGVEAVTVSLNDGYAEVELSEDSRLTLADIREVIRKNGFSPKDANVRVSGKLAQSEEGQLLLKTDTAVFELEAEEQWLLSQLSDGDSSLTISGSVASGEGDRLSVESIE
jgi:copper chaperone CopZ